jgi:NRAMP (natural resistance-associated macrophage protein)-like metal ion transporter
MAIKEKKSFIYLYKKFGRLFRIFGPGLITGAADDDPSGIATYAQTGAKFGYGQLWTIIFMYPMMTAVQEACARIGVITGKGLAAVIREQYSKKILYFAVALVIIANVINIGADIGAIGAAVNLLIPIPFIITILIFTAIVLGLELFLPYTKYVKILKWLTVTLLAYPITLFLINEPWKELLKATFIPHIDFSFGFLFIITGVLGTTISPYMFFWQASEEVEEEIKNNLLVADGKVSVSKKFIRDFRIDNALGMFFSQIISWSIIALTATVLFKNGVTEINSAADAAKALEPLVQGFAYAGFLAKTIFAIGIIGVGLLAVPIFAGSAAYAVSEIFSWNEGLYRKVREARGFYGVIVVSTIIGLLINFLSINPIKALIFTAVLNGVVAIPLIYLINRVASNEKIMGEHRSGWLSKTLLWITFISMAAAAITMFITL